jgi:uncharacterized protein
LREVIVFTKVPERGHVKTRLQKRLPPYAVEELYTAFLMDTLDKLREYYPFVAYYPESKLQMLWQILGDRKYLAQRGADMGEKLINVFSDFYKMSVHDVVVVGCDVPTMRTEHLTEAFALMGANGLVMGPSHDGGFYLIGGKDVRRELFEGVAWEGAAVFDSVKANAERLGIKVGVLPRLHDIDTPEDLDAVWASGELPKEGNTYRVLKKLRRA